MLVRICDSAITVLIRYDRRFLYRPTADLSFVSSHSCITVLFSGPLVVWWRTRHPDAYYCKECTNQEKMCVWAYDFPTRRCCHSRLRTCCCRPCNALPSCSPSMCHSRSGTAARRLSIWVHRKRTYSTSEKSTGSESVNLRGAAAAESPTRVWNKAFPGKRCRSRRPRGEMSGATSLHSGVWPSMCWTGMTQVDTGRVLGSGGRRAPRSRAWQSRDWYPRPGQDCAAAI